MSSKLSEAFSSASAIAKGMGITFKEMLQPTITEDYPESPAKFQERFRGVHELQRDENGLEKCVACFLSAAASATPRSITSITIAASSAGIAWRPAPPMPS